MISLIVACSINKVIGKDNKLPWKLPNDLKYFRSKTLENIVIMGRKTFESIGFPLPKRRNIIISSSLDRSDLEIYGSLEEAIIKLNAEKTDKEIFIIGGGMVYKTALDLNIVDRIYLTEVDTEILDGDVYFNLGKATWKETQREFHDIDEKHDYSYSFIILEKLIS